jgi:hypothetical protein
MGVQTTTTIGSVSEQQLVVDMWLGRQTISKAFHNLNNVTRIVKKVKGKLHEKSRDYTTATKVLNEIDKTNEFLHEAVRFLSRDIKTLSHT